MKAERRKTAAAICFAALAAGFAYAGAASVRLYAGLVGRMPASGSSASIDEQIASLNVSSADIRAAVQRAAWPSDADVLLTVQTPGSESGWNATQLHYAFGYLLFPKRIWLTSAPPGTQYGIVIGTTGGPLHKKVDRISDVVTLVDVE